MSNPLFIMLVGAPGSGKTTYRKLGIKTDGLNIVSSDDYIEIMAGQRGMTYNQSFQCFIDEATKISNEHFRETISEKRNVIIDKTNMTVKSRRKFLSQLPKEYTKIAVVMETDRGTILERNNDRDEGRKIKEEIVLDMLSRFEYPTINEGFDLVITHNPI